MSHQTIKLNPKQCWALLSSIVDCEPTLYKLISDCSKEYTENPERYEQEAEMFDLFYEKLISRENCDFSGIEYLANGNVELHYFDRHHEGFYTCEYDVNTKTFKL